MTRLPTDEMADLRLEAEALLMEMSLMLWRSHEYGQPVNLHSVMRGHQRLSSAQSVGQLRRALAACPDPIERRALEYFLGFVMEMYVGERIARQSDRLHNAATRARVRLDGRSVPYRALPGLMANEPSRARRRHIQQLTVTVVGRLNPQYDKLWRLEHDLPRQIGYSYVRMSETERHVCLRQMAALARQVLAKTERLYFRLLDEQSRAILGYGADRIARADVWRLMKNVSVEQYFPPQPLVATAEETARGLGCDLRRMGNLRIFSEDRPNKAPRACCFPLKVPGDVRLSVRPVGGVGDYEALLHELGHGLHFARTTTDQFEFQHLGGGAVTETYAFLIEHLIENRNWLAAHTRIPEREAARFLRFRAFAKLYAMRRYAAKILYEIHFHSGRPRPRETYRLLLSEAYGFELTGRDATTYLSDIDATFYAADYFRAWLLEAALADRLERRFGRRWFERKGAGQFLARLWASGNQMTADDLLAGLGHRRFSVATWLDRVRALLSA